MHKPTMRTVSRWLVVSLVVVVGASIIVHGALVHPSQTSARLVAGQPLDGRPAPDFTLRDQDGRSVRLSQLRGQVVVITFLDAACTGACDVGVECMDETSQELASGASRVVWLGVSLNSSNTAADAKRFLEQHHVTVPLHILLGSTQQLSAVWQAYAAPAPLAAHASSSPSPDLSYIIDATGHERELLHPTYDPKAAARDILALSAGVAERIQRL